MTDPNPTSPPASLQTNVLYYGDNLPVLQEHIPSASVDLIYLDPPFNSSRNYNVLFKDESGYEAPAQITAFKDTWHWDRTAQRTYHDLITASSTTISSMIEAMFKLIGPNQMMAYLVMMTARLVQLHRVLKPTGSLYLHCDPTASHYLKIVLDAIFGKEHFQNEIIWKRTSAHSSARRYGPVHDVIFFYTRSDTFTWNEQPQPYSEEYLRKFYRHVDEDGRRYTLSDLMAAGKRKGESGKVWRGIDPNEKNNHWKFTVQRLDELDAEGRIYWPPKGAVPRYKRYLDEMEGLALQSVWTDIPPLGAHAKERLGYPTQKPVSLLERIIYASSNPGDVVLDPFCGCGTAIVAAQQLNRRWIGIDITHLAVALQKKRMLDVFDLKPKLDYTVIGEPQDLASARQLFQDDPFQFQFWATSLLGAMPLGGEAGSRTGRRGPDRGIDGLLKFSEGKNRYASVIVQVKGGRVGSKEVRDLRGTLEREQAAIAILIILQPATREMRTEATQAGMYTSELWQRSYPRVQIVTIEELLSGHGVELPPSIDPFKRAERAQPNTAEQRGLEL